MSPWELGIVMFCYMLAAYRELVRGDYSMSWIWFTYSIGLVGFIQIAMRAK